MPGLLDALGVSSVIVRHDLVRGLPNRYFADDRVLAAAMARVPGATLDLDGTLQLWRFNGGTSPTMRTYDRVLDAPARPEAGAAVLGTVGTRTAVAAREGPVPAADAGPQVDDTSAVTPDVVHWPVPAVDSGSPATTVDVPAGGYTLAQRARAAPVFVPRFNRERTRLLLIDPTVVKVDGVPVSRRPLLSVPVPSGREILAVRAGTRTVSLDGPYAPAATAAAGTVLLPRALPIGSATPLTLYTRGGPVRTGGYRPVSDCNNYEPRPWAELGISQSITDTAQGRTVRLTAADHAACTEVRVLNTAPGRIYRIRLQYRHLSGARPQICLAQAGIGGCELGARSELASDWVPYERIVTMDSLASRLSVILHADVTARFAPRTVVEYRGLRIEALQPLATRVVWPPAVPPVTVRLAAGRHELRVEGGPAGSVLRPFEPLEDCFRYDDESMQKAGLSAEAETGADGETTFTLTAIRHLACVAAPAVAMGASSLYELSMQTRSLAVREPKFCLFLRGPDRCRTMPTMVTSDDWTPYEVLFPPDPTAVETRLYLYGMRDFEGLQQSRVQYRGVRLRPVATPSAIVLVRQERPAGTSTVHWARVNPARFSGTVTAAGPTIVALAEAAAPGWALTGIPGARKVILQGWMSGWAVPHGGAVTLRYTPARWSRYALYLLPVMVVLAVVAVVAADGRLRRLFPRSRT